MTFKNQKENWREGFFLQIVFFLLDVKNFGDCDYEYAFEAN